MYKVILSLLVLCAAVTSHAAVINTQAVGLYQGDEYVNEHPTGRACYLYVDRVGANDKGKYCHAMTVRAVFSTDRDQHPQEEITVESRVTNYHRPEYPQIKTCAMTTENKTSGMDIYQDDDTQLYIQFLSWNGKYNGAEFDLFVTNSPETKAPSRVRLHKLTWFTEKNYDCLLSQKL